jgi:hypothetical protein
MRTCLAIGLAVAAQAAFAQYKCTAADGAVSFQQAPCSSSQAGERMRLVVPPSIEDGRPEHIKRAIAERKIVLGVTRVELDRVMR